MALVVALACVAPVLSRAQEAQEAQEAEDAAAEAPQPEELAAEVPQLEEPTNVFLPLPVLFYTPETKLAFGASAAWIFRTGDPSVNRRPSSLGGVGIYTLKNQVIVSLGGELYWDRDRKQLSGGGSYQNFPNDFYGLGNDTDADFSESYTDEGSAIALDYSVEVVRGVRVGGGLNFGASSITDTEPGDLLRDGAIPGGHGGQVLGAGLKLAYDTRMNISYPRSATYCQMDWRLFDDVLGADFSFSAATVDLRRYLDFGERKVLAVRALGQFGGGDVPFQVMPALGGDLLLRGYFQGRFRERKLVALQSEFRGYFWKRLGGVVFGGLGQVAHEYGQLGIDRFHYSAGAGLRILLVEQEGLNLRADFGFGSDQSGFYLGFGEVF
jgi:hypothetical protein